VTIICLKACKRCSGDMSYESDIYGWFRQCLQCSYLEDFPSEAVAEAAKKGEQAREPSAEAAKEDRVSEEASDVG